MDSKRQGGIDLHVHSNASDGTHSPVEILQNAARLGLQAISITDHDTTEGSRQALACERPATLDFITGVEISAKVPLPSNVSGSLHILGYGIDPDYVPLVQALEQLRVARNTRTHQIVERLNQLGIDLTVEQVQAEVGQATPGRPHVARAMIKVGVVKTINEAFDRFIGHGGPAFVGKKRLSGKKTMALITAAGGVPVLAHPCLIKSDHPDMLEVLIEQLCGIGLMGLEAYYPDHSPDDVTRYLELARKFNLVVTGGSDFHGQLIPDIQMGRGRGNLYIPYTLYENLKQRMKQH